MQKAVRFFIVTISFFLFSVPVWAELYQFSTFSNTVFTAQGNMYDVRLSGNCINLPEGAAQSYNMYGQGTAAYSWILQPGNAYDFTGTLSYINSADPGKRYMDIYQNGVIIQSRVNDLRPRTGFRAYSARTSSFWAPY